MRKAVFLDRDGTIIEDTGYVSDIHNIRFLPGAAEAIKLLNEQGFLVIIITNQAGVARGYFTEEYRESDFLKVMADFKIKQINESFSQENEKEPGNYQRACLLPASAPRLDRQGLEPAGGL